MSKKKDKKTTRELRKLDKISFIAILLFLVLSIQYYSDLGNLELVRQIGMGVAIFSILGVKHLIGIGKDLSDGIDIGL